MKLPSLAASQRFLVLYSGALTAVIVVVLLAGWTPGAASARFDEITVQRINVVEPNGTLRMIVSNKARSPGIYLKRVEHLPGFHAAAGMIFLNDEGTENGGLIFGGAKDATGKVTGSGGGLTFDQYMQDQLLLLGVDETDGRRSAGLTVYDRPDWDITEAVALSERVEHLPEDQKQAELAKFNASHAPSQRRAVFGRGEDRSSSLRLKDDQGRDRVILRVPATGDPVLQFLDPAGKVIKQLP